MKFYSFVEKSIWLRFAAVCTAVASATSCGRSDSNLSSIQIGNDVRPIVMVMGGRTSCAKVDNEYSPKGMGMYVNFQQLLARVEAEGKSIDWVLTCYRENADVHYILSSDPNTVITAPIGDFNRATSQFLTRNGRQQPILVAGHSYGGWLAMKTVQTLPMEFDSLFAIDAISRVHCAFDRPFGCTSAPQDFDANQRAYLNTQTDLFANYYQTRTFYLHSSPISQADRNIEMDLTHNEIDRSAELWASIEARTLSSFHRKHLASK
jgi:pimeloyl-ACP methyl ester carboxylesterase